MKFTFGRQQSDSSLISAVKKGDKGAYEQLFVRYYPTLLHFIRGMLKVDHMSEDIAPNDRGDQFAVVLLSAESEFHGRLSGFAYVPCGGLRLKDKKVFHKDGILSCDKIVKKQPAS